MHDPMIIEVTRGERVESRHAVTVAVVDADGTTVLSRGDTEARVYPRSAIKVFQAIPLVESGAADAFGFSDEELALACASHSGEEGHVALAAGILERVGLTDEALECGCHWPFDQTIAIDLARRGGTPTALHNNCSGKHAGFLCTAVHLGETVAGYVGADHPVQRRALSAIEDLTGAKATPAGTGIDGCAIPTYALPLEGFAKGFARIVSGTGVAAERAAAGRRLIEACMAEPWAMSGSGRACLTLMQAAPGRVFAKTGAEGVFCGAAPEFGIGFALKVEDGTTRAAESAVAAVISDIFSAHGDAVFERYRDMARKRLSNWNGETVGEVRPAGWSRSAQS